MHTENLLALLEIHVGVYAPTIFARKWIKTCSNIGFSEAGIK